jgi:hypothetical protein
MTSLISYWNMWNVLSDITIFINGKQHFFKVEEIVTTWVKHYNVKSLQKIPLYWPGSNPGLPLKKIIKEFPH